MCIRRHIMCVSKIWLDVILLVMYCRLSGLHIFFLVLCPFQLWNFRVRCMQRSTLRISSVVSVRTGSFGTFAWYHSLRASKLRSTDDGGVRMVHPESWLSRLCHAVSSLLRCPIYRVLLYQEPMAGAADRCDPFGRVRAVLRQYD